MPPRNVVVFCSWVLLFCLAPQARALDVVTSIKPVHSLVAAVMKGVAVPYLIIRTTASPHGYHLKPSDATALEGSQLVFWMGAGLENFLSGSLDVLAPGARSIALLQSPGIQRLQYRNIPVHENISTETGAGAENSTRVVIQHDSHYKDPHVWLNPDNARHMLAFISQALIAADPENAPVYRRNTRHWDQRLEKLGREINTLLSPIRSRPYIVYHDAYQYFERYFKLSPVAVVSLNPELPASARQIRKIKKLIRDKKIRCLFTEPQYQPRLLQVLLQIPGLRNAELDPVGAGLPPGPGHYESLMRSNARSLKSCLSG